MAILKKKYTLVRYYMSLRGIDLQLEKIAHLKELKLAKSTWHTIDHGKHSVLGIILNNLFQLVKNIILFSFFVSRNSYRQKFVNLAVFFDLTRQHLPGYLDLNKFESFVIEDFSLISGRKIDAVIIPNAIESDISLPESIKASANPFLEICSIYIEHNIARQILIHYFFSLPAIFFHIFTNPRNPILFSDCFKIDLAKCIDTKEGHLSFVITNNSLHSPDSFMYLKSNQRQFKTFCVLYSENNFPHSVNAVQKFTDLQWLHFLRVDTFITWSREFADYLANRLPYSEIRHSGSIMFISKPKVLPRQENIISVFDMVPSLHESPEDIYNLSDCLEFLKGISSMGKFVKKNNKSFELLIKHKRRKIKLQFQEYHQLCQSLEDQKLIKQVNWNADIYDLISSSRLVICAYGTSPAIIAREFGIPVAYFYPGKLEIARPLIDYGIPILRSSDELIEYVSKFID